MWYFEVNLTLWHADNCKNRIFVLWPLTPWPLTYDVISQGGTTSQWYVPTHQWHNQTFSFGGGGGLRGGKGLSWGGGKPLWHYQSHIFLNIWLWTLSKRSATIGWRVYTSEIAGNGTSQLLRSFEFQLSILYFLEHKYGNLAYIKVTIFVQGKGDILSDGLGEGC